MNQAPRFSLVVPVWNEGKNIGRYCAEAAAALGRDGYELVVAYDMDEDDTLPALRELPDERRPTVVRTVKNVLGRGVRYAIEQGMRDAAAPVVVVMMADVSDDFSAVIRMVEAVENGADVVCGSRYCKGGKQVGGPLLKRFLSRMAGVSLHWLIRLPTHDVTNSFKAYKKTFLDRTPIESTAGFCLGMELTVKAHAQGGKVTEIPASWHDRSEGESRFRLFKWLPSYLHWYWFAIRSSWFGK